MNRLLKLLPLLLSGWSVGQAAEPIADIHLHYKWNQAEKTSVQEALAILDRNNVELALVTGTPPEFALKLADADPQRFVVAYGLYQVSGAEKSRWSFDREVLERAREALAGGRYQAIGEVHMIPGFMAKPHTPVIKGLLELALQHDLVFWLHTEFSQPQFLTELCSSYPQVRFLWAHAGSVLNTEQIDQVMAGCPNLWMELAARDPWRHRSEIITGDDGLLKPDWRALVTKYQDRTLTGSDPVWPVEQLDAWDRDDTGWQELGRFLEYHRGWLAGLPPEVAQKIRLDNAKRLFRRE
jgi:predicted TIM-barrel fold metal-dependent hydrolase